MGKAAKPRSVKLVIGMLAKNQKLFDTAEEFFIKEFGVMDYESPVIPFHYTNYYKKEMGSPLKRKFITFKKLISPGEIAQIKIFTNALEEKLGSRGKRRINIDPGYVSDPKLVLATTKDYFHRIYLDKGIFAEVTLKWRRGGFEPFEWTYPDYRSKEYISIFNTIRNNYMKDHAR